MADTKLDVEKARVWQEEVEAELAEVKILLKNVAEECETRPEEEDTLLKTFYEAGLKMESTWNELGQQFDKAVSGLQSIIDLWKNSVQERVDDIKDFVSNIKII